MLFNKCTFSRHFCPQRLPWFILIFTHWWRWLPCKVPTTTSGAVWGSVSCHQVSLETSPWISASFSNLKLKGHSVVFLKNFLFFFYLIKLNYQLYLFSWLNKQTDLRGQHNLYCLTLFMCGRPCHLSSFKQCSGTLFSPENSLLIHWWNNICIITSLPLWILKLPVWIFQHYVLPL